LRRNSIDNSYRLSNIPLERSGTNARLDFERASGVVSRQ